MSDKKDTGAWLEGKFQSWLHQIPCFSHKFSDFKALYWLIQSNPQLANRIPKAPCDRLVIYEGKSYFFELKHIEGKSLPLANIKDHQIGYLLKHKQAGLGRSFLVIGYKYRQIIDIYALEISDLIGYIAASDRRSIPIEYAQLKAYKLENKDDLLKLLNL